MKTPFDYDVALSFAGEDRQHARALRDKLKLRDVRVFYDKDEQASLWGKDLFEFFFDLYKRRAAFCVVFASRDYAKKNWTNHERKAAQARAFEEGREYILPIRVDDTEIPGLSGTTGTVSLTDGIEAIADMLVAKLATFAQQMAGSQNSPTSSPRSTQPSELDGPAKARASLLMATIKEWETTYQVSNWDDWMFGLGVPRPELPHSMIEAFYRFKTWLPRKIWPVQYKPVEHAFRNFGAVLDDFLEVMYPHFHYEEERYRCNQYYRIQEWNKRKYNALLKSYQSYMEVIRLMVLELTKAANLICFRVRSLVDPSYRLAEGHLVIIDDEGVAVPAEYSPTERRKLKPYQGLSPICRQAGWKRRKSKA